MTRLLPAHSPGSATRRWRARGCSYRDVLISVLLLQARLPRPARPRRTRRPGWHTVVAARGCTQLHSVRGSGSRFVFVARGRGRGQCLKYSGVQGFLNLGHHRPRVRGHAHLEGTQRLNLAVGLLWVAMFPNPTTSARTATPAATPGPGEGPDHVRRGCRRSQRRCCTCCFSSSSRTSRPSRGR
jgi:hypothetical protein